MLSIYLKSVLIYMIMIFAATYMGQYKIKENGWVNEAKKLERNFLISLFCLAAIPVLRFAVVLALLRMTSMTKEDFEKKKKELENEQSD